MNETKIELRRGWTTGACAAAAAGAAYGGLKSGSLPAKASVRLPGGQTPVFDVTTSILGSNEGNKFAQVGILKDGGDDPDVTHGLEIIARVEPGEINSGICFKAGDGVGTVTLPGLPLAVGEPAINPGPRAMIIDAVMAQHLGLSPDDHVIDKTEPDIIITISVPGGQEVSKKTMNARLGIIGGISILGTSGIVIPYSCASWIHAIRQGIDVAGELKINHLLAATGRTSESSANEVLKLSEQSLIDMGDFAGGMLKYLTGKPFARITIAGGFGKITKLSQGAMDLHSSRSKVDMEALAKNLGQCGASAEQVEAARNAQSAAQVLQIAGDAMPALAHLIARQAREVAMATLAGGTEINVWVYDRPGILLGTSDDVSKIK